MKNIFSQDNRGVYQRDLGWKEMPEGRVRQHRFFFGRERTQALLRCLQVEQVWDAVVKR